MTWAREARDEALGYRALRQRIEELEAEVNRLLGDLEYAERHGMTRDHGYTDWCCGCNPYRDRSVRKEAKR